MAHILIVEDAPDNRTIAELILQNAGHTVVSVGDGASAERYFRQLREQYPSSDAARIASRENPS